MALLILIRHGESVWNKENRFTGWINIPLSKKGLKEARDAGEFLKDLKIDIAYTSKLIRAHQTLFEILRINNFVNNRFRFLEYNGNNEKYQKYQKLREEDLIDVFVAEELNERYYGELQGLNKDETKKRYGEEKVFLWRRSYDIAPPMGRSLKEKYEIVVPFFKKEILNKLNDGMNVLISAHGNSLRALIKHLENIPDEEISKLELPTGKPVIYEYNNELFEKKK